MGWRSAVLAEIVEASNEALAEMVFPNSIDDDSACQGMIRIRDPCRKGQSAACLLGIRPRRLYNERRLAIGQHGRNARAHQATGIQRVASAIDVGRRRIASIPKGLNSWLRLQPGFQVLGPRLHVVALFLESW